MKFIMPTDQPGHVQQPKKTSSGSCHGQPEFTPVWQHTNRVTGAALNPRIYDKGKDKWA
jgi:hypothetical protein